MKGDFSRDTFNKSKHYRTVRMQQGRVQLDADWNEQLDIFDLQLRNQFTDLIGEAATPVGEDGFKIIAIYIDTVNNEVTIEEQVIPIENGDVMFDGQLLFVVDPDTPDKLLLIKKGRYYVAGAIAENEQYNLFIAQPDLPDLISPETSGVYILYLDLWQRHISTAEDPELKESALNGVDTTSRIKLISQVKSLYLGDLTIEVDKNTLADQLPWQSETAQSTGQVAFRLNGDAQLINRFYRVEIHQGGDPDHDEVSFKWSRDNGSIVRRIKQIDSDALSIDIEPVSLSQQDQFQIGDWIELSHESLALQGQSGVFVQLTEINDNRFKIMSWPEGIIPDDFINGTVRHWNSALLSVVSGSTNANYISIDSIDGNQVMLDPALNDIETLFSIDQLVELTNQALIDEEEPGLLARIEAIDTETNGLTIPGVGSFSPTPQFIRPEGHSLVNSDGFIALENGIEVKFEPGDYHVGDYWTVSSRSLSNSLDWPLDEAGDPASQTSFGIQHHYVPLALFTLQEDDSWDIEDYRTLFAPSAQSPVASAADKAVIVIDESENVGIGTTSPTEKLDVNGVVKATQFDGFGIVPIGTIQAWHKDLPDMPALPDGWAECNGQVLGDPDSPLDGQTLPDLNYSERFLRGGSSSGVMQDDAFQGHTHNINSYSEDDHGRDGSAYNRSYGGTFRNYAVVTEDILSHATFGTARVSSETRPKNMSVIWIIRIK